MKKIHTALRLDADVIEAIKVIAPEGNVSMWIRMLIDRELKANKNIEEMANMKINEFYNDCTRCREERCGVESFGQQMGCQEGTISCQEVIAAYERNEIWAREHIQSHSK